MSGPAATEAADRPNYRSYSTVMGVVYPVKIFVWRSPAYHTSSYAYGKEGWSTFNIMTCRDFSVAPVDMKDQMVLFLDNFTWQDKILPSEGENRSIFSRLDQTYSSI